MIKEDNRHAAQYGHDLNSTFSQTKCATDCFFDETVVGNRRIEVKSW